ALRRWERSAHRSYSRAFSLIIFPVSMFALSSLYTPHPAWKGPIHWLTLSWMIQALLAVAGVLLSAGLLLRRIALETTACRVIVLAGAGIIVLWMVVVHGPL